MPTYGINMSPQRSPFLTRKLILTPVYYFHLKITQTYEKDRYLTTERLITVFSTPQKNFLKIVYFTKCNFVFNAHVVTIILPTLMWLGYTFDVPYLLSSWLASSLSSASRSTLASLLAVASSADSSNFLFPPAWPPGDHSANLASLYLLIRCQW